MLEFELLVHQLYGVPLVRLWGQMTYCGIILFKALVEQNVPGPENSALGREVKSFSENSLAVLQQLTPACPYSNCTIIAFQ